MEEKLINKMESIEQKLEVLCAAYTILIKRVTESKKNEVVRNTIIL